MEYKNLKIVKGDLFKLANDGAFDVIAQGNNCFCAQGAGIAVLFNRIFKTLEFPKELIRRGDISKLGEIDFRKFRKDGEKWVVDESENGTLTVVNCYTQYSTSLKNGIAVNYDAVRKSFSLINLYFKSKRIGLPAIGAGLAGGDLNKIKEIMDEEFKDCDVTLVILE